MLLCSPLLFMPRHPSLYIPAWYIPFPPPISYVLKYGNLEKVSPW